MRYCRAPADKKGAGGRIAACNLCGRRAGAAPVRSGCRQVAKGAPHWGMAASLHPPAWGTRLRAPAPSGCARGLQGRGWGHGGWTVTKRDRAAGDIPQGGARGRARRPKRNTLRAAAGVNGGRNPPNPLLSASLCSSCAPADK